MRLLFYIHSLTGGGAERVLATLVSAFMNKGYECGIAQIDEVNKCPYSLPEGVSMFNVADSKPLYSRLPFNKIKRRLWKFHSIRKVAKEYKPDVVISFITALNNDVIFSLLGTGLPVIVSEHTNITRKIDKKGKHTFLYRKICYPFANAVTVLTRRDYRLIYKKHDNVVYMPNPCDVDNSVSNLVYEKKKVVFTAGRVSSWWIKGYDLLLTAWGKICKDYNDWRLVIAGDYNDKSMEYLQQVINDNNCKNVDFIGFRRDVYNLMTQSEVYCLSSRIEGLPMGLIEAMSAGCCCVAFDCETGPNEIIVNNESGLLAAAEDIDDLCEKLRKVMSDDSLRNQLSSRSKEQVKKYSVNRVVKRWEILFELVLKGRRK